MAWPLEATQGRAVFRDERNYLEPRTTRLRMVWQSFNSSEHPNLPKRTTASASAYAADVANTRQGQYAYLLDGSGGDHATFRPVSVDGTRLYSIEPAERSGITRVNVLPQLGGQTFLGIPRLLNGQLTKFNPYREVVIQSAGQTHTLRFSDAAGGMLTYWSVQIPASSVDVQVLNRGNSYLRGLQGSATWVDSQRNSLHRHSPMQGGSYYSAGSGVGAADQHYAQGSVLVDFQSSGNTITVSAQPIELDPDGAMAIPGVGSGLGGGQYAPVIWKDMKLLAYDPQNPLHNIEIRGCVVEMTEEGAVEHDDELAQLYLGKPDAKFFVDEVPAELESRYTPVRVKIAPTHIRVES